LSRFLYFSDIINKKGKIVKLLKKEFLFFIFLGLLILFIFKNPNELQNINNYINYPTIQALTILLILTTALQISKVFDLLAIKFINIFHTEKSLALFFISITIILSMFLTNDITLFIIVPLTIAIFKNLKNDITKLIIFEAIASNVGSLLTPIGNPQNLYLFHIWNISFFHFIYLMLPLFIIQTILIFIFAYFIFSNTPLTITKLIIPKIDKFLFVSTSILFVLYIILLEFHLVKFLIPIIIVWYLFAKKEIFIKFDYFLILTFILMFIDFHIIADFDFIKNIITKIDLNFLNTLNISIFLSQIMSNVPATIFISQFSHNYQAITYGVNLAASGLIISSLANIIAIRLNNQKGYFMYHKYGIPYFIFSYITYLTIYKT